jgi:glycerol-3-phosphate cytidylyltransferase-like family protein
VWNTKTVRDKVVRACAWCNKVFINGKWVDVNYTQQARDKVTHGICESCRDKELKSID